MSLRHEILIVGGGLVGASLAVALADAGWDVGLTEPVRPGPAPRAGEDYALRVSAISPGARAWLTGLDAWPRQGASRICAYQGMHVWTSGPPGALDFDAADIGLPALGHITENSLLLATLWERLRDVTVYCPARLSGLTPGGEGARVRLEDGREIGVALVVGADGGASATRRLAGMEVGGYSYGQRGLVAVATTSEPHRGTAWQRFLDGGPLALLPLADGRVSIVWSAPENEVRALERMPEDEFRGQLEAASQHCLGRITAVGPRASFPLRAQYVPEIVAPRIALVGDAAHVVHPLAGQGVNLGFMDARALAAELGRARSSKPDPGALRRLKRYARARKGDNLAMLAMTDALHRLFTASSPLVRLTRGPGLTLVDALGPVKSMLIRQAAGRSG